MPLPSWSSTNYLYSLSPSRFCCRARVPTRAELGGDRNPRPTVRCCTLATYFVDDHQERGRPACGGPGEGARRRLPPSPRSSPSARERSDIPPIPKLRGHTPPRCEAPSGDARYGCCLRGVNSECWSRPQPDAGRRAMERQAPRLPNWTDTAEGGCAPYGYATPDRQNSLTPLSQVIDADLCGYRIIQPLGAAPEPLGRSPLAAFLHPFSAPTVMPLVSCPWSRL